MVSGFGCLHIHQEYVALVHNQYCSVLGDSCHFDHRCAVCGKPGHGAVTCSRRKDEAGNGSS